MSEQEKVDPIQTKQKISFDDPDLPACLDRYVKASHGGKLSYLAFISSERWKSAIIEADWIDYTALEEFEFFPKPPA